MKHGKKVIGIVSPKGGVGKTVTTSNLAVALSTVFNKRILAIDTNLTTASLGFHFNLIYPRVTIYDVLKAGFSIQRAIYKYNNNLDIIPASIVIEKTDQNFKALEKNVRRIANHYDILLTTLIDEYDYVLLDAAGGFSVESFATMEVADIIYLVTNPEYPSILATAKAIEYAKLIKVPVGGIILAKVKNERYELSQAEIEESLGMKVLGSIPLDTNVPRAIGRKMPVMVFKPHSAASVAYKKLAADIIGEEYNPTASEKVRDFFKI